jgi:SAM-dependent methyltransferase
MDELAYRQFLKLEKNHWWFIGRRRILSTLLHRFIARGKDLAIMDVGCGFGGMLENLSDLGHPMGLEIDLESARICRERGFTGICLGSGYQLPFRPGSLDLITLFDAIEHMENDSHVVEECAHALKPGGSLVITVPAYQCLYANNDRMAHHLRRYTLSRLKRIAKGAELKPIKGSYFNVILFPIIFPIILLLKAKQLVQGPLKPGETAATNLSYRYPRILQRTLEAIFSLERFVLPRISAPFGHSIVLIARKSG